MLLLILAMVLTYIIFAVCGWSFNPGHWGGLWRGLFIFLAIWECIILAFAWGGGPKS